MINLTRIYIAVAVLLLSLLGCEKLIYDETTEDTSGSNPKVYLSVTTRAAQTNSSLRSSINTDADFEDHVYNLAMVIFENGSDNIVGEPYFNSNLRSGEATYAFTVEMDPGKYDFYFIANVSELEDDIENITDRANLDNLMNSILTLDADLYTGATNTKGFPMARVYMGQKVNAGGTVYQPLPFKPKFESSDIQDVITTYNESGTTREFVELIRVVAKLEINFDEISAGIVDEVKYHNAFGEYSLIPQLLPISSPEYVGDAVLAPIAGRNTYVCYMPEALMGNSITWEADPGDNKPINYFSITTLGGDVYNVPIITTDNDIIYSENYLAKATGTDASFTPNYNIYRNHHYKFNVRIHQDIEIIYKINPWDLVKRQLFMGYGYNVEIDEEGEIVVSNTIDDCLPHKIELETINGAHFGTNENDLGRVFGFSTEADTGFDWDKLKTTYSENYTLNTDLVSTGNGYLNIYYNGDLVKTFMK
jgi:hypothetical protein